MQLHSNILGKGKPFVILHGFLGMGDNWKTLGSQFSEAGFEVHLVDQRNHGRSFHDELFNYEVLVEDLINYCEAHQLEDIVLLGHSMGGKTAMLFATIYPELVSELIIADISPRFYPIHHDTILKGLSSFDFETLKTRGEADKILSNYVADYGTRLFLLKNLYWIEKGKLAWRMNLSILEQAMGKILEALPEQEVLNSSLFVRGGNSNYILDADMTGIEERFLDVEFVTIDGSGHWVHAEAMDEFLEQTLSFLLR